MLLRFLGANRTVTGSSHLLEVNGLRILLDCGIYQGPREESRRLNSLIPEEPESIDAVILSHGHLDHCGKLPVLVNGGFRGPIYCTRGTAEVARIILEDAAEIQEEDAAYLNRRSLNPSDPPIQPLYRRADVPNVLRAFKHVELGARIDLNRGVTSTFFDAGHILGSCYVWIEWHEQSDAAKAKRTMLFTADIGRYDTPIIRDPQPPPGDCDVLLTESTYGGRSHESIGAVEPQLLDAVRFAQQHKSRLLLPAFAVGRTQTLLWYLTKLIAEKRIDPIRIYIDSPMGVEMSRVYVQHNQGYDEQTKAMLGKTDLFGLSRVTLASTAQESRRINEDRGPCVIIASSPTCEFGRILHHLSHSVENPNDQVLFCGFIPPNTLGRRLQDGNKRVRIYDRWYDVKCHVRTVHGLSAHADGDELMRFLQPALSDRTQAWVVHGEPDQAEAFAARLMGADVRHVTVPAMTTSSAVFAIGETVQASPAPVTDGD
jgi:metallo-beta-lactamase family protein